MTMSGSTDWQLDKTLAESNRYMLMNKLCCDVSFEVGSGEDSTEIIEAHKYVLVSRSPVFFSMFCGDLAENLDTPVRIPDMEPDIFRDLLNYVYCDITIKDSDKLEALIYGAEKYLLSGMVRQYSEWLSDGISQDTICPALNCATLYSMVDLRAKCLDYILIHAQEVIQGPRFPKLSRESLRLILSNDELDIEEAEVFEACLRWAREQCRVSGYDITDEAIRAMLGDCLHLIRFTEIPGPRFVQLTRGSTILSTDERLALQEFFITGEEPKDLPFNSKPRKKLPKLCRFQRVSEVGEWNCHGGKVDAISFSANRAFQLKGVCLYGGKTASKHDYTLELLDASQACLTSKEGEMESTGTSEPIAIRLLQGVSILPGAQYTVKLSMKGPPVYKGVDGKDNLEYHGLRVSFFSSRLSKNGTEKNYGQIPGLLFQMLQADCTSASGSVCTSGSSLSLGDAPVVPPGEKN